MAPSVNTTRKCVEKAESFTAADFPEKVGGGKKITFRIYGRRRK